MNQNQSITLVVQSIEDVKKPPTASTLLQESSFLLDKTDTAIQLYNFVVKLIDSQRVKYTRRAAAKWITFYGKKPKAFLIVQFEDDQIKLRLRLDDDYNHQIIERLKDDHDKLAMSGRFLHQVTVKNFNQKDDLLQVIMDSYNVLSCPEKLSRGGTHFHRNGEAVSLRQIAVGAIIKLRVVSFQRNSPSGNRTLLTAGSKFVPAEVSK